MEFLRNSPFFSGLSGTNLTKFASSLKLSSYERVGEYVLTEGEPADQVCIIQSGLFEIVKKDLNGLDDKIMSFLAKGEVRKNVQR